MSDTPRTDQVIDDGHKADVIANHDDLTHYMMGAGRLAGHARSLEREVTGLRKQRDEALFANEQAINRQAEQMARADELARWKSEMLQVESQWDEQALAKLLGGQPGRSCRKIIQEKVPELVRRLEESRAREAGLRSALKRALKTFTALEKLGGYRSVEADGRDSKLPPNCVLRDVIEISQALAAPRSPSDTNFAEALTGTTERNPNGCGCWTCNPKASWFVVCDICGNKRCPHATDHALGCTGSNEPGQEGSVFSALK